MQAHREEDFPVTIVRPSHTYNTIIPVAVGRSNYAISDRILSGKKIIVPGDGTSLWTVTHAEDFASGFIGLLGNAQAIGHSFHITSDELLTWNQIYESIGEALGAAPNLLHIPTDFISQFGEDLKDPLVGDRAWSVIFDCASTSWRLSLDRTMQPAMEAASPGWPCAPGPPRPCPHDAIDRRLRPSGWRGRWWRSGPCAARWRVSTAPASST